MMGISDVKEEYPLWKNGKVVWIEEVVQSDPYYQSLLHSPQDAISEFTSNLLRPPSVKDLDWYNHVYALHILILEICSIAANCSLVEMFLSECAG
jgi:hypothetical protein